MTTRPTRSSTLRRSFAVGVLAASLGPGAAPAGAADAVPTTPAATTPASTTPLATTAAPTPQSGPQAGDPSPASIPLAYAVDGYGELRTGIRGKVAIVGKFVGAYAPATGAITGGFTLTPTQAKVTALGIFPVVADTDWIFTEPVTGSWKDGVLRLRIAVRIRHPKLTMFGLQVAGGANCATRDASIIELRSEGTSAAGGPAAAPTTLTQIDPGFAISGLSGCGPLDGFLSAVAAGGGNRASLKFTPLPAG